MAADVMTLSPTGQIALSQRARQRMGVKPGSCLVGFLHGNTMVLQAEEPGRRDYRELLDEAADWAEQAGLTEADVEDALRAVRAGEMPDQAMGMI